MDSSKGRLFEFLIDSYSNVANWLRFHADRRPQPPHLIPPHKMQGSPEYDFYVRDFISLTWFKPHEPICHYTARKIAPAATAAWTRVLRPVFLGLADSPPRVAGATPADAPRSPPRELEPPTPSPEEEMPMSPPEQAPITSPGEETLPTSPPAESSDSSPTLLAANASDDGAKEVLLEATSNTTQPLLNQTHATEVATE